MADIDLKAATPDTTLPTTGFLFGADSQAAASPSVYSTQTVATTLLGSTSLTGATITADAPVLNMSQTWNSSGVTFTGLRFNATNTLSASGSFLLDLQIGGTSNFAVRRYTSGPYITLNNNGAWIGGKSVSGTNLMVLSGNPSGADSAALSTDNFYVGSSIGLGFCAGSVGSNSTVDTILTRRAAANLRLGAADAAAPVAQTLSVQSVVAGTTNTAGANLTITGSQGTGTGAGGSIIFQVAPAGSSGTAQNALATALTINSSQQAIFADGADNAPSIQFAGQANTGLSYLTNGVTLTVSGSANFRFTNATLRLRNTMSFGWSSGNPTIDGSDVLLFRDAANTLALRNGANAQAFRVYNTFTSATDFERANIFWDSNVLKIGTEKGSAGGTARALELQTDATSRLTLDTVGSARIVTALTVATLPATPLTGMIARVTDALAPAVGVTVAAGGAAQALCWYNGANWTVIGV